MQLWKVILFSRFSDTFRIPLIRIRACICSSHSGSIDPPCCRNRTSCLKNALRIYICVEPKHCIDLNLISFIGHIKVGLWESMVQIVWITLRERWEQLQFNRNYCYLFWCVFFVKSFFDIEMHFFSLSLIHVIDVVRFVNF